MHPGVRLETYPFNPRHGLWFTYYLIQFLGSRRGCFTATLDIGVTWRKVCVVDDTLATEAGPIELSKVAPSKTDRIVFYDSSSGETYEIVRTGDEGYYKLKATGMDKPPTIEINGIHMHRIKDTDPWIDARRKINTLRIRRGERVLDTCLGLGYTAIHSLLRGAEEVVSFEISGEVIWIAEHNPWSSQLSDPRMKIIKGDAVELIKKIPGEYFHKIIHDPPRYSGLTGNLYSLEFYRELYRVLEPGGRLFHYTGEPRRHGTPSIIKGIGERLRKAGFHPVFYRRDSEGYVAIKPLV